MCNGHVNPKSATGPKEGIKTRKENGSYYSMLGLYRDSGKEDGNHYNGPKGGLKFKI